MPKPVPVFQHPVKGGEIITESKHSARQPAIAFGSIKFDSLQDARVNPVDRLIRSSIGLPDRNESPRSQRIRQVEGAEPFATVYRPRRTSTFAFLPEFGSTTVSFSVPVLFLAASLRSFGCKTGFPLAAMIKIPGRKPA